MLTQMLGLIREHAQKLSPRMGGLQHSADSAAASGSFGRSTEEAEEKLRRGEGAQGCRGKRRDCVCQQCWTRPRPQGSVPVRIHPEGAMPMTEAAADERDTLAVSLSRLTLAQRL